jgi:SAM-dependent methyltransferase
MILRRLKRSLERKLGRRGSVPTELLERHVRYLVQRLPELEPLAPEPGGAHHLLRALDALEDAVPVWHEHARETLRRNTIVRLFELARTEGETRALTLDLARSQFASGVIDRAVLLFGRAGEAIPPELEAAVDEFERRYAAKAPLIRELPRWLALKGEPRSQSLLAMLEARADELRERSVVHVSPEAATKAWLNGHRETLRIEYRTLDPFDRTVDLREDLTALSLPSESVDYMLCHRVLEHVLDDAAALSEIHRVLRPGGILNVSVPMGMQMERTNEWLIRDRSHDEHVRHYGRDFEQRLHDAGFSVSVDRTLLDREVSEHEAAGTYPMRIYVCLR